MPIRINLLAESQAAEEVRRRDPVKRAVWGAVIVVALVLVWSSTLQVKIMSENGHLGSLEAKLNSKTNEYARVLDNQKKLLEVDGKLSSLNKMAAGRFLQTTLLDAFMHTPASDGIQINHLRTEQGYDVVPDMPATKSEGGKMMPGKPGYSNERVKLYVDARDGSSNPGIMQVNRFKDVLAHTPYFADQHMSSNSITLKSITPANFDPETQKPFVLFTFECQYPDRIH